MVLDRPETFWHVCSCWPARNKCVEHIACRKEKVLQLLQPCCQHVFTICRWILFPPEVDRALAKGKGFQHKGEDDEAIVRSVLTASVLHVYWRQDYFSNMLPRIKNHCHERNIPYIEFVQRPGETVFIPGGWWHGVLNLDDTIAVTQNFASQVNFPQVACSARRAVLTHSIVH